MSKQISFYAIFALCLLTSTVQAQELKLGAPAPAATLVTLDGHHISTRSLHGQTVILTFWASWCEPCRHELPLLSRFAAAHKAQGLTVLAFSLDDDEGISKVRALAKQFSFPVGLLDQSSASGYGRMWRVPVSFVIDRNGILRYNGWKAEHPAWTKARLKHVVDPLLNQSDNTTVSLSDNN